jgi:hypothetical protein
MTWAIIASLWPVTVTHKAEAAEQTLWRKIPLETATISLMDALLQNRNKKCQ